MGWDFKPSQSAGICTEVFVPAVTRYPGGCAGSRQRCSEFRQFLGILCWKVGTVLGLGSISESTIRPGVLPSAGIVDVHLPWEGRRWRLIPIVALLPLAPAAPRVLGTWSKGQWVLGTASPQCCAGTVSTACHSQPLPGLEGPALVLAMTEEDQELLKYSTRRFMGETTCCFNGCSDSL